MTYFIVPRPEFRVPSLKFLLRYLFFFITLYTVLGTRYGFSATASVTTYDQLLKAIRQTRHASEARLEAVARQEKVREAWETGKLIDEHILLHKERADYGEKVIERLAEDLESSSVELRFMVQFARAYPIRWPASELSWSHYQSLMSLNDPKERDEVANKAEKEHWTRDRIREEVRKRKTEKGEKEPQPEMQVSSAKPGKIGTYKIVKARVGPEMGKVVIDLGFSNYYKTTKDLNFKEGDIIESVPAMNELRSAPSDKIRRSKRKAEDLYTYRAHVYEVLDGDTFKAVIDLGFGVRSSQTLRLRGLDAPEIISTEGKEAKKFLEQKLLGSGVRGSGLANPQTLTPNPIIIRSVKSDKYDRYLVDVFVNSEHINQKLIEQDLAVVVDD